jgi:enoyl-CoA hydratase
VEFVAIEDRGSAVEVLMNRPNVNAVNIQMYSELRDCFNGLHTAFPGARVVILRGEGKHFCAGNDLDDFRTMTSANAPQRMQGVREAFWAIHDCVLPVIAMVQGAALGTGLALAASSDLIVASEDSRFGLPEVSVGVMGGARHLARLVPQQIVRYMFLTSAPMSGAELASFGGVLRAVPSEELYAATCDLAGKIAQHSATALRIGKRALNQIEAMDLKQGYEAEQGYTGDMADHPDAKEALLAMAERRAPSYAGNTG